MSQIRKLESLFKSRQSVDEKKARKAGIRNLRQQVYFLRKEGHRIINTNHREYKIIEQ